MARYDSAGLLARCKLHARRPAVDQAMPDASWFAFLTDAQAEAHSDLFSRHPDLAYPPPYLMETDDDGDTYHFGNDGEGDRIRPAGHAEIYASLADVPSDPLRPGSDFLFEGDVIRMLGGGAVSYTDGPYARLVLSPDYPIDAATQPLLYPKNARLLLVWKALEAWAARPGSGASPLYYAQKYNEHLDKILIELATAYNMQNAREEDYYIPSNAPTAGGSGGGSGVGAGGIWWLR